MNDTQYKFISEVLGEDGAVALRNAAQRTPVLGTILLPRTILSWINTVSGSYDGAVPGLDNSRLQLQKNESGFNGLLEVGEKGSIINNADHFRLAAIIGLAIGSEDNLIDPDLRDIDLTRLGKSIDVLAKAKGISRRLTAEPPVAAKPALPKEPEQHLEPTPPGSAKATLPRPKRKTTLKITKSQAQITCSVCKEPQFRREQFSGCLCLRELAKHVVSRPTDMGYVLSFNDVLDQDTLLTLFESLIEIKDQ